MKTSRIVVYNDGRGMSDALSEVERFGACQGLNYKEALRFRLLAEEMMRMVRSMMGRFQGSFWAEGTEKEAELYLEARARADYELQRQIPAFSGRWENPMPRGFMGRVRGIFESFIVSTEAAGLYIRDYEGMITSGDFNGFLYDQMWTMSRFKNGIGESISGSGRAGWNGEELKNSIVARMADEVLVGKHSDIVQLVIKKTF